MKRFLSVISCIIGLTLAGSVEANELLINGNGSSSSWLPCHVSFADEEGTVAQTMYYAYQLVDISSGGTIHAMKFYPKSYQYCDTIGAIHTIRMFESDTAFDQAMLDTVGTTIVYEGPLPYCNSEMPITLSTPYTYHGGNLVIDCKVKEPSSRGIHSFPFNGTNTSSVVGYIKSKWATESVSTQPKVLFDYTPVSDFCSRPEDIRLEGVSFSDVTISWTPGNMEEEWEVKVDSIATIVATPSYTLTGISPATSHSKTFAIRAICGAGDTSAVCSSTLSFNTNCYDMSIPWVCDFESATPNRQPPCWTLSGNTTIMSGSAAHDGENYLSLNGTNGAVYAITPRLAQPANKMMISFYEQEHAQYPRYTTYGQCVVGTITDPSDITTFTPLVTLPASKESYRQVEYFLKEAPSTDYYVMFYYNGYNTSSYLTNYCYIDSIQIDVLPTCFPVTNIRLGDVSATTAELSWTPGKDEQAWDVLVLSTGGDTLFNNTVTDNHCTITDLTHKTPYTISAFVRANCGNGDLSRVTQAALSFETPIACGTSIITLPYTENFESTTEGALPQCWSKIISGNWDPYTCVGTTYGWNVPQHDINTQAMIYHSTSYNSYTILPMFSMDIRKLQIGLWAWNSEENLCHGSFIVGAMSDPNDSRTFFPIDTLPQNIDGAEHLIYLDLAPIGYKYIAILYKQLDPTLNSSVMDEALIDNIVVDFGPGCLAIEDITLDSVGANNASFSWKPKRANPYGYEVTIRNEYDNSVLLSDTVFTPALRIIDLDFSSEYRLAVSVATICQPGNISEPFEKTFLIKTECQAIDSLYRESFEHFAAYPYKAQSISTPNCWDVVNANSPRYSQRIYVTDNASYVHNGKQSLLFEYSYDKPSFAIMPELNVDLSTQQISFFYHLIGSYHPGKLTLGYFPKDSLVDTAFVAINTMSYTSSWNSLKDYRLENVPNDVRLAFKYYTSDLPNGCNMTEAGIAIDDILIEDINNCHPPLKVWYDSLTSHSVQIHWNPEFEDNTEFNVVILHGKDTLFHAKDYADTACVIENLESAKYYALECRISTACADRTSDLLKSYVAFVTECAPFAVPYTENFDDDKFPLMAGDIPFCWSQWGDNRTGMAYWNIGSFNDGSITHSGSGVLNIYADSTAWSIVALPEFETSIDSLYISFYSRIQSADNNLAASLEVGYLLDPTDATSFVTVAVIPKQTQYTLSTIDFQNAPENVHRIAFRLADGSILCQANMDDITVNRSNNGETAIEAVDGKNLPQAAKFIREGKLFILRDGKVYTVFGTIIDEKNNGIQKY